MTDIISINNCIVASGRTYAVGSINWQLQSTGATGFVVTSTGSETAAVRKTGTTSPGNDDWLKTVQIASDDQIGNTVIDALEFGTTCANEIP